MRRTRIKFCGMTRTVDIDLAVQLGVDAIGLVFVPGSKRVLQLEQARELAARVPPMVTVVALVADPRDGMVEEILASIRVDLLQFHGNESNLRCRGYHRPFVKALAMGDDAGWRDLASYPDALALLLDGHASGEQGGQGRSFDWSRLPADVARRAILAGGLHPGNVAAAVAQARPYAVDVSSGIESTPGCKDPARMERFVMEVRRADGECAGG